LILSMKIDNLKRKRKTSQMQLENEFSFVL